MKSKADIHVEAKISHEKFINSVVNLNFKCTFFIALQSCCFYFVIYTSTTILNAGYC